MFAPSPVLFIKIEKNVFHSSLFLPTPSPHPFCGAIYFDIFSIMQAFDVFDNEGYGYIALNELESLLSSVDDTLTRKEKQEILEKAGTVVNGQITLQRKKK